MEDNHHIGKPTVTSISLPDNPTTTVLPAPLVFLYQMISHTTRGLAYSTDTKKTWIHTPQHLNPHSTEDNLTLWILLTVLEVKLISLLIFQTGPTMVARNPTPNPVAQMALEAPVAPADQEDQVVLVVLKVLKVPMALESQADPTTTIPISKISYGNS